MTQSYIFRRDLRIVTELEEKERMIESPNTISMQTNCTKVFDLLNKETPVNVMKNVAAGNRDNPGTSQND